MEIDIQQLRNDLLDYYGTAAASGISAAIITLAQIEAFSDQELLEYALKENIYLEQYTVHER
jgi:hypothetical protein